MLLINSKSNLKKQTDCFLGYSGSGAPWFQTWKFESQIFWSQNSNFDSKVFKFQTKVGHCHFSRFLYQTKF